MIKLIKSQKGLSIVAAVFTLIVLGIFGAAIVALVAAEQEFRAGEVSLNRAFYNVQAGLEYAIRKIYTGQNPVTVNKPFGYGTYSVAVNYIEGSNREIIVTGNIGNISKTHQITHNTFGADCLGVNNNQATLTGNNKTDLKAITITRMCNEIIVIDKIGLSWTPDGGTVVKKIKIDNDVVWEDVGGVPSGTIIDIVDTPISGSVAHQVNLIEFSSNMYSKEITMQYFLGDTTMVTHVFTILPPQQK